MTFSHLKGNVRCVKFLLSKGADPLSKDDTASTALHLATRHRSSKCLDLILNRLPPGGVDDQVRRLMFCCLDIPLCEIGN